MNLKAKLPARIELATFRLRSERTTTMLWKQDAQLIFTLLYQDFIPLDCFNRLIQMYKITEGVAW